MIFTHNFELALVLRNGYYLMIDSLSYNITHRILSIRKSRIIYAKHAIT